MINTVANKLLYFILLIGVFIVFDACKLTETKVSPDEYITYISNPKNGLVRESKIGEISFTVEYKPELYMALLEVEKFGLTKDKHTIDSLKYNYNNQHFFVLKIAVEGNNDFLQAGLSNQEEYFKRVEYYNTQFLNDVLLISGSDTIACLSANIERNFGISPQTNISLLFENNSNNSTSKNLCILIDDKILGTSKNNFCFDKNSINNIPQLNIQ